MRTVIYARFSSALQNARSIEDQVALCRQRCKAEGWQVVEIFTDHAISGAAGIGEASRPGLNALLARVEAGGIDQVLAEATDRIARHQGDAFAIRERITFAGARLFTLGDGEVTDITATFRGLMDAQFRRDLASKVKRGQVGTIGKGRSAGGMAYGYRKANRIDEDGNLVRGLREIDPEQARIVRRIFEEFAAGQSPRSIAAGLNEDGVPAPGRGRKRADKWRGSTIYGDVQRQNGLLRNRIYIGELVFNRTRKVTDPRTRKTLIRPNPPDQWVTEPVPDLQIVDRAVFDTAQARLAETGNLPPQKQRRPRHMLSGIAHCGTCGSGWTVSGSNRWSCSLHREGGTAACGNNRTIGTAQMEERVLSGLRKDLLDPALVEVYVREYHREHARRAKSLRQDAGHLQREHAQAAAQVDRLVSALAEGGEEFAEIRAALRAATARRDEAAQRIEQLESLPVIALHPTAAADYRQKVERLNDALASNPEARLEAIPRLRDLIDDIRIHPDTSKARGVKIEVTGKIASMLSLATGAPVRGWPDWTERHVC